MQLFSKKISTLTAVISMLATVVVNAQPEDPEGHFDAMLGEYCLGCHNFEDWAGGVAFDAMSVEGIHDEAEVWENAVRKLRGRLMPPPGNPQPDQAEIDGFVAWMQDSLDQNQSAPVAGHVPVQRMNRGEYTRAVKALLGVDINAAEYLPMDIEVDGFDNIAAALTVSPAFTDQYVTLARKAASLAVGGIVPKLESAYYPPMSNATQNSYIEGFPLGTRGGIRVEHNFPADGEYLVDLLSLGIGGYPRSMETEHTLIMLLDGEEVFREKLGGLEDLTTVSQLGPGGPGTASIMERFTDIPIQVEAGVHELVLTFIERARSHSTSWTGGFGGGGTGPGFSDGIQIDGPFNPAGVSMTPSREKIFICQPQVESEERACAERIAASLAQRAFRRQVTAADIDSLMPFYEYGRTLPGGFDAGIEQVIAAVLVSPDFLYRALSPTRDIGNEPVYALSEVELASRLSFFLWSEPPDEQLLTLALDGNLSQPGVLDAQVQRMLQDKRASALVDGFAMKWLNVDDLTAVDPDPDLFRQFNESLRADFGEEISRFLSSVLLEDRPVTDLMEGDWTYLNERLANHYGIDGVLGPQFRRVELDDERRWGLLGKAAVLLRTSYGDRTSPVLRGAWVLERIMGTPATPPPPNVETDLSVKEGELATTVRARLENHRDNPGCNQCHGVIDPIGLAMENFTVIGQWRDNDAAARVPIDASTVMPNGTAITGPVELRRELMRRPDMFVQALTEKLMMYAVNREIEYFDMPQVRAIVEQAAAQNYTLSSLVEGIVSSDAFRLQAKPHETGETIAMTNTRTE